MRREANFDNIIAKILTKNDERGKRNDVIVGVRKELNFSNEVTKIPSAWIFLPRSMKCPKEKCSKGKKKKPIVAIKLLKFKGREEREKGLWQPSCQKWDEKKKKKNYDQKILNDVSTKDQAQRVAEGLAIKGQ